MKILNKDSLHDWIRDVTPMFVSETEYDDEQEFDINIKCHQHQGFVNNINTTIILLTVRSQTWRIKSILHLDTFLREGFLALRNWR